MSWTRIHHAVSRKVWRGASFTNMTPRGKWLYELSKARWEASEMGAEARRLGIAVLAQAEIGRHEGFRFIETAPAA